MPPTPPPRTVFLDSGVIVDGCFSEWSAAKGLLILAAQHPQHYTIVLAEAVDAEVRRALMRKAAGLPPADGQKLLATYPAWLSRVQVSHWPLPIAADVARYRSLMLPALKHLNDLPAAVTALQAQPDWVLSTNGAHWGAALAGRTGLRVAHPREFLEYLSHVRP